MPPAAAYGIFELGMNHPGEIAVLARLVRPHVAVITTVEPAHLGFFPSLEAIADAKAEIFLGLEPGGIAVLNRDNRHFDRLSAAAKRASAAEIIGFGTHPDATVRLLDCVLGPCGSTIEAALPGAVLRFALPVPGRHWAMNSLAVLAAAGAAGADPSRAAEALAELEALPGRGRRCELSWRGGTLTLIDESYNASPAAMRAAFAVLGHAKPGPGGRRIAVLGDMREMGPTSPRLHAELAAPLVAAGVDLVLTCGPLMVELDAALPRDKRAGHTADSQGLIPAVVATVRPGDVVLVKGSLGTRMAPIVEALLALEGADRPARRANGK